jgi:hypothetical protein
MRRLRHDPMAPLLATDNLALLGMARRDLLDDPSAPAHSVCELPEVRRILARQQVDGRWKYAGGDRAIRSEADYDQLEMYRQLGVLVNKFGIDRRHPAIVGAANFLRSFQTDAGLPGQTSVAGQRSGRRL